MSEISIDTLKTMLANLDLSLIHISARRVSDSKSAEHKKSFSAATWIFCMEPNCFGV